MSDEHIVKSHNRTLLLYHLVFPAKCRLKKDLLWGGSLWTSGFYANTVGLYASKDAIRKYIQNQGKDGGEYRKVYEDQPELDFGG